MKTILNGLNLQMSRYLMEFDCVFTARISEDFDILVNFDDKAEYGRAVELMDLAKRAGAAGWVTKPFSSHQLDSVIATVLASPEAE